MVKGMVKGMDADHDLVLGPAESCTFGVGKSTPDFSRDLADSRSCSLVSEPRMRVA
jgi:hypothetical protein